jgi:hypothetical protein
VESEAESEKRSEARRQTRLGVLALVAFSAWLLASLTSAAGAEPDGGFARMLGAAATPTLLCGLIFGLLCIRRRWRTLLVFLRTVLVTSLFICVGQCASFVLPNVEERLEQR